MLMKFRRSENPFVVHTVLVPLVLNGTVPGWWSYSTDRGQ